MQTNSAEKMPKIDKKTIIILACFALVVVLCALAWFMLRNTGDGTIAVITIDGEEYKRIDLSKVKEDYDLNIDTEYGHNTVHVMPGAISISEADCPDGVCVHMGAVSTGGVPIVCMPHRLIVQIEGGDLDA